jgi:hypothetical protein
MTLVQMTNLIESSIKQSFFLNLQTRLRKVSKDILLLLTVEILAGECGVTTHVTYDMYDNSSLFRPGVSSLEDCYTACVNDKRCSGFEIRTNVTANANSSTNATASLQAGACYHSIMSNVSQALQLSTTGAAHFDIIRTPCGS